MVQLGERRYGDTRRANLHPRACDRIQHPSRDGDDHTRRRLEMDDLARAALLTVMSPDPTSMERVPAVVHLDELPDMGRMTP